MNKEIYLQNLRNFLSDLPSEEREQAIKYYEDYFEDAGIENEQQVIEELGLPFDLAQQIKSTTQENIEYGKGNSFHSTGKFPDIQNRAQQGKSNTYYRSHTNEQYQSQSQNGQQNTQKKHWTQDSAKVTLLIVLALLAIPVGIPVAIAAISTIFAIFVTIISLIFAYFVTAGALVLSGITSLVAGFVTLLSSGIANTLLLIGVGLILASIGILMLWFGVFFCKKFFPAFFSTIEKVCASFGKGFKNFFS